MWSFKCAAAICFLLLSSGVRAEGFVLGFGVEGDSADGRAVSAFGDFGIGDDTWLTVLGSIADTEGIIRDNETLLAGIGLDHSFGPVGVKFGIGYWGNSEVLDSRDVSGSFYIRGDAGSVALDYERRNFEFDLQSDALRGRTATFSADGWGLTSRLSLGERVNFFLGGMVYDYSRNLRIQQDIDVLTFISRSRLSMINALIDDQYNAGLEFEFGLRSLDVTAGRWQTAIDGGTVDSYSIGFLTPIGDRIDGEFRVSFDDSEFYGRTTALSFYFYYFGGA